MTAGFWWILFSLVLYGGLHSLLASRRFKAALLRRFGPAALRWHRFLFSVMGGLTILPVLALTLLLPDREIYAVEKPFSWLLNLLRLAGLIGLIYGVLQTGFMNFIGLDRVLDPAAAEKPPRFVTNGLYRWVRHPLYTSAMLLMWAAPNLSWNTLAFNLGVSAYLVIGSRYEEQKLLDEFGSAYEEYRQRTPGFLPGIRQQRVRE
ncbi:MAG: methyltransferase family protein [Bellilinea sp.]